MVLVPGGWAAAFGVEGDLWQQVGAHVRTAEDAVGLLVQGRQYTTIDRSRR